MDGYDELLYRFFKAAVGAYIQWGECSNSKDLVMRSYCERWLIESKTYATCCAAVAPYVSPAKSRQIKGLVMRGKFDIELVGGCWEVCLAAPAR